MVSDRESGLRWHREVARSQTVQSLPGLRAGFFPQCDGSPWEVLSRGETSFDSSV